MPSKASKPADPAGGAARAGASSRSMRGGPVVAGAYVALDLDIPSDVQQIEGVIKLVTDQLVALGLPARVCSLNVPVALSEALANAIISGNHSDPTKVVHLRAMVSDDAVVFDVVDQGSGFDLATHIHAPETRADIEREDGRGLFLMRELMDDVQQFRDHGNVVRLTVHR